MNRLTFFIVTLLYGLIIADKLPTTYNGAPYPPSGWRPNGAGLQLPNEYGPPPSESIESQRKGRVDVQVTQERVDFAGQFGDEATTIEPSNEYLPPTTQQSPDDDDNLRVQGLPKQGPNNFNSIPPARGNLRVRPQIQSGQYRQQQSGQFRQQQSGQFRQQQFGQIRIIPQQQQSGRLIQVAPTQFNQQLFPQPFAQQQQQQPAQEYGPPQVKSGVPTVEYGAPDENRDVERETTDEEDGSDSEQGPVIAVSNSFERNGQYYILNPDNTLQRVVYMTAQTDDDREQNGFTAQLRYAPVDPIRDPIYAYDAQGQLIKIYNKK